MLRRLLREESLLRRRELDRKFHKPDFNLRWRWQAFEQRGHSPRRHAENVVRFRLALAACRRLGSEPEREALALRELEGLSFDEIAGLLDGGPLAGIEVMAGVLRRKIPASPDAQALLTDIIKAMKLTRDDVYIANVIKCRPPGNRNPEPDDESCGEAIFQARCAIHGPAHSKLRGSSIGTRPSARSPSHARSSTSSVRRRVAVIRAFPSGTTSGCGPANS